MKSNHEQLIFTEDIDYSQTGNESIWGNGDQETVSYLQEILNQGRIKGTWLIAARKK